MDAKKKLKPILIDMITNQLKDSTDIGVNTDVLAAEIMVVEDLMTVITGMYPEHKKYDEFHDTICGFVEDMNERFSI